MNNHDSALPIWALEVLQRQPNKSYVRLRDIPDHYFSQMKKYMPRNIRTIDNRLCITRSQFVRLIDRYNVRAKRYERNRRKQLQSA